MSSVRVVVEGETDIPFARKILGAAGLEAATMINQRGKTNLDPQLAAYNAAAAHLGWFVLRDLDHDAECALALLDKLLPARAELMCIRIPVRAIESWAMGDSERLARHFAVREGAVPLQPELELDPKQKIVSLVAKSTNVRVKRAVLPRPGTNRKAGPGYEASLIEFGEEHWRWRQAQKRCPSLKRCIAALRRLRKALESRQA